MFKLFSFILLFVTFAKAATLNDQLLKVKNELTNKEMVSSENLNFLRASSQTVFTTTGKTDFTNRESLTLLTYATYAAFLSKDKILENSVKAAWKVLFNHPSLTKSTYNQALLTEVLPKNEQRSQKTVDLINYFLNQSVEKAAQNYFFPLVSRSCSILTYLRKLNELEICWKKEIETSKGNQKVLYRVFRARLSYYSANYGLKERHKKLADEILANKNLATIHGFVKFTDLQMRINEGDTSGIDSAIKELKSKAADKVPFEKFDLGYLIANNKLEEAKSLLQSIESRKLDVQERFFIYQLGIRLFAKLNDFKKVETYANKIGQLGEHPLNILPAYLTIYSANKIWALGSGREAAQKFFQFCQQIVKVNNITNADYLNLLNTGLSLTAAETPNLADLRSNIKNLEKTQAPSSGILVVLRQLLAKLEKKIDKAHKI